MEQAADTDTKMEVPASINEGVDAGQSKVSPDAANNAERAEGEMAGVSKSNDAADNGNLKADMEGANIEEPFSPEPNASKGTMHATVLNPN